MSHQIVVIGGGAGGLALAVRLGKKYRSSNSVSVLLVDKKPAHLWKPLLHEVATGSLDSNHDEVSYVSLARKHGFKFLLGTVTSVDPARNVLTLDTQLPDHGDLPRQIRSVEFNQLVLAMGSLSNDFGTPGVAENALLLDDRSSAERFHQQFIAHLHRINNLADTTDAKLRVVIVGGGATGVELAADLHNVTAQLEIYGFDALQPEKLDVTLLEAGPRLLAQLPQRISESVLQELGKIGVVVKTDSRVTEMTQGKVALENKTVLPADIIVWAAGIRAPELLRESGLPTDRIGRVIVTPELNVPAYPTIFAIGDCCHCPMENGDPVPPRAQSAHQMAATVYKNLLSQQTERPLKPFVYHDLGSLVSLSNYSTVGNLMGNLMRGSVFIEGWIARIMYRLLYRIHQRSIHGTLATGLIILGDKIHHATRSHLKLH